LTGDPITQAEGEYNAEVGDVREDLEVDQEELSRLEAAKRRDENNG
jgi:uncharacterized protein YjbJ (UPF0337 family)